MNHHTLDINFSISSIGSVLLVNISEEIDDNSVNKLLESLAGAIVKSGSKGVIIDLSNIEVVDSYLASKLSTIASMASLLKAKAIVCGLKSPTIITLLEFGIKISGVEFALDVDNALEKLKSE